MSEIVRYTVRQACEIMGAELPQEYNYLADEVLTNITHSVNTLSPGGAFLLFGKTSEERKSKLKEALAFEQKLIFYTKQCRGMEALKNVPHVQIGNINNCIRSLCVSIRKALDFKVIAITGSIGKTSTKEMVYSVLKQNYNTTKTYGNTNTLNGIFSSFRTITNEVEYHVQEVSMSYTRSAMEMKATTCIPDGVIITNISDSHIEMVGSRKNILKMKKILVTSAPKGTPAFLNYDDKLLKKVVLWRHPKISYAINNKKADYYAQNVKMHNGYMEFEAVHKKRVTPVRINAVGLHNISNALCAMAVGEWAGMPLESILRGIAEYKPEGIRQSLSDIGGYKLYIDCYNAAPMSMVGAINTLEGLKPAKGGRRIAVVGQMLELGKDSPLMHTQVGTEIGKSKVDLVICYGQEDAALMAKAAKEQGKKVLYTNDRKQFEQFLKKRITRKDITLFKASHAIALHKSIDRVFGTSFYLYDDYTLSTRGNFRIGATTEEDEAERMIGIMKYNGKDAEPKIPFKHHGAFVRYIGKKAFAANTNVEKIKVPRRITNIGEKAFEGCSNLKEVILPEKLLLIEENAFCDCTALETAVLPQGLIGICEGAFKNCVSLKKIVIPDSVGSVAENAFEGCGNIEIIYQKDKREVK